MSEPATPASAETVRALIERQAAARPDGVYAIAAGGGARITFGELARACRAIDSALEAIGVAPGETISTVMGNGLQTLRVLLGAMHAGRRINPVNLLSNEAQMRYVLGHGDARLVIATPEWEERVRAVVAALGAAEPSRPPVRVAITAADGELEALLGALQVDAASQATRAAPAPEPAADDVALLMYTSGTTGVPKGVMLTQRNLAANALAVSTEHALAPDDRVLGVLPLYHINAFVVTMLAPLAHGGSVVVSGRFSAAQFWPHALAHRCTWLNVVPTIVSILLEGDGPAGDASAAIRFCRSASAPLAPEHHRAFEAKFGIGIVETMGLTETAAPSFSNPIEAARRKVGSVGRASGGEARVVGADFAPLADGATGEIVIRGPHVMRGYYKDEAATRNAFTADGWMRTGDLAHRDADGFFFVTGRIKELIIKGGENIAPREIDEALLAHPAVLDAAAVGIDDRHYGQEILAGVVLREGASCSEDALRDWCIARLGRYKTPKVFRFLAELPRGPSGKVQRRRLLDDDAPAERRAVGPSAPG